MWIADPTNPGWWYKENSDVTKQENWAKPPEGYIYDTANPGWWYNPNGNAADASSWWQPGNWYDPVFKRAKELYYKTPYVFGGDRTSGVNASAGWDCIGYVMECLDAHSPPLGSFGLGIHQGYINAERARQACTNVNPGQEQPGDLIFFKNTYPTPGASHVGIVLDPIKSIMADDHDRGNNTGPGETNYSDAYWKKHFMQFGRVPR